MNMQMCRNGHFYNREEQENCPYCEKEAAEGRLGPQMGITADFPVVGGYMESKEQKLRIQTYLYTATGGRSINQDRLWYEDNSKDGIWVIADGLGGHRHSELASAATVQTVERLWRENHAVEYEELLLQCHQKIKWIQKEHPEAKDAASTILLARRQGEYFSCAHAGDSRLYYFRDKKLMFRTKDHSVAQISVTLGEITEKEQSNSPDRNKLYNVLGGEREPKVEIQKEFAMERGDAFLLCTDGFWQNITEEEITVSLLKTDAAKDWAEVMLAEICKHLPKERDNCSLICGRIA